MGIKIDLTSHRYGRLTVVREADKRTMSGSVHWSCICDCGKTHVVSSVSLRNGATVSCGCYNREKSGERSMVHGKCGTPEYNSWSTMIQRCHNKNNSNYQRYGARGITVCNRWRYSFLNFFHDMGSRPSLKFSIEREDNNGNYNPENCSWATCTTQNRNQRIDKRNISGTTGVTWCKRKSKWEVKICANYKKIHIGHFDNLQDAVDARKGAEREYWNV